jgi:gamma-glutamyltranspeptidase/glutathione hydrolase
VPGYEAQVARAMAHLAHAAKINTSGKVYEPTAADMRAVSPTVKRGDTVHIDVIDAEGNFIAAMPSGGWLQSSPVIPELGFMLNSRAQMFWLEEGLPSSLAPGKRPRTTLTPTLAEKDGKPYMVFGSPGGDQQEQWQMILFLRHIHHGLNLQEAIDLPMWHTAHFPSSFYPREQKPGNLTIEASFPAGVLDDLAARGHTMEVMPEWSIGRLVAARRRDDGVLAAAATPRLMQAYAVGR